MTDRSTLYRGLSHAAWGWLFLILDFNLGNVSVLPRFVGWLLFLSAIEALKEARRDLALLRPLAAALALWNAGDWLLSWGGGDLDGRLPPLDLLVAVMGIYFHFQFLTDLAAIAETAREPDGPHLARELRRLRSVETVLVTALSFTGYLPRALEGFGNGLTLVLGVIYALAGMWLMLSFFSLRKLYEPAAPMGPEDV